MTNITVKRGNIFDSQCQTLVNTVNCDGVMGAGIALEFKLRQPEMFQQYVEHCKLGRIEIGKLWIYHPPPESRERRWVLNFPTKKHWKNPSRMEYLEAGLSKFMQTYSGRGIQSIAFPLLGASNGGIPEERSLDVMQQYLSRCDIPVEIYRYDSAATDDLYQEFRRKLLDEAYDDATAKSMAKVMDLRSHYLLKVRDTLATDSRVNSLSQLAAVKGIGQKTLEKCFRYVMDNSDKQQEPSQTQEMLL